VPNEPKEIKVTDKRMFTAEGELKEEYRLFGEKATAAEEPAAPAPPREEPPAAVPPRAAADLAEETARLEFPSTPPGHGPTFFDLVLMLAEPASLYLGDVELPGGQVAENLEMARAHIDLLDVLRQKTMGNLNVQESAFLEDLLYRLRVRYVQKRG
jgi:hypothetical protein